MFGGNFDEWLSSVPKGSREHTVVEKCFDYLSRNYDWEDYRHRISEMVDTLIANNPGLTVDHLRNWMVHDLEFRMKVLNSANGSEKFLLIEPWIVEKAKSFVLINRELEQGEGRLFLDLGCGGCHLLTIAKTFGFQPLGVDLTHEVFDFMTQFLRIERRTQYIDSGFFDTVDLPADPFYITAELINFNILEDSETSKRVWQEDQWDRFLEGTMKRLAPGGRVLLILNPQNAFEGPTASNMILPKHIGAAHAFKIYHHAKRYYCMKEKPVTEPD